MPALGKELSVDQHSTIVWGDDAGSDLCADDEVKRRERDAR